MTLRGASADALAALTSELERSLGLGADAAKIADDLFGVALVLRTEPGLRRVATDVAVPAPAKQSLIRQIFEGKLTPQGLALVGSAVGRRWTLTRDLADALESLSQVAVIRSAGRESGRLADELFTVAEAVKNNPELRDALSDPARSTADKETLLERLLAKKALPATLTLTKQALAGTYRTVGAALDTYQRVAAQVHGQGVATVSVAQPLAAADQARLQRALSAQYGREVHLNVVVRPDLLGGIRVEIGDDVIDGTVASKLADARRQLAG